VVEKPDAKDAPSDYAILGRYVFTPKIFSFLEQTKEDKSGEIQLTDAIHSLLSVEPVYAFNFAGTRYDIGSSLGYVIATIDLAIVDPEIKKAVINHIRKLDI
jgi:UTP--glucose-1-phosphate uridylyltransferase